MLERIFSRQRLNEGVIETATELPTGTTPLDGWAMPDGPCVDFAALTPANTTLTVIPRALYIGTAGNVTLRKIGSSTDVVFKNLPSGAILPVAPQSVRTSTTAADIVALY